MSKFLVTITGPSGSGKTELLNKLVSTGKFSRLISVTTRPIRAGEKDGVDYHFTSEPVFKRLLSEDEFVQYVHFQGRQYYGSLKYDVQNAVNSGSIPVVIVEPSGIPQFKNYCNENGFSMFSIFMDASFQVLVMRYLKRMSAQDLDVDAKLEYHSARIAAIHDEHVKWRDSTNFDCTFLNSGDNLLYISEMADMVGSYLQEKKV